MRDKNLMWWKCSECGFQFQAPEPPHQCPNCAKTCTFIDITCYTPDCGGPESGNYDPRLAGQ